VSRRRPPWSATVRLRADRTELARWLERALRPEAAREVPRARTVVRRVGPVLELTVEATDAGAMRAALNTYLGWIALSLGAVGAAGSAPPPPPKGSAGEAVISRPR
jgi:tRNA threonylcarbamoyladenosine modification (KEOPS) complex  Pcc1 subunit